MNRALRDVLTGPDDSHDMMKWAAWMVLLVGLGLQIYAVGWRHQPFSLAEFGAGASAMFMALGLALRWKAPADAPTLTEVVK